MAGVGFTFSCPESRLTERHLTIYLVGAAAIAEDNPLNYGDLAEQDRSSAVRLFKLGGSLDYTLFPSVDLALGFGGYYFAGPRFENFWQEYAEARATLRPLVLLAFEKDPAAVERNGWLLFSVSRVLLRGRITGADFGAPLDPLNEKDELLWSFDMSVDVVRFLRNLR